VAFPGCSLSHDFISRESAIDCLTMSAGKCQQLRHSCQSMLAVEQRKTLL
jgi:hypothetical protein